jgi:hypothetical protein
MKRVTMAFLAKILLPAVIVLSGVIIGTVVIRNGGQNMVSAGVYHH